MIKRNPRPVNDGPLYRHVLRDAFVIAWRDKRYWWLALLASILFSAGIYDVMWRAIESAGSESGTLVAGSVGVWSVASSGAHNLLSVVSGLQLLIILATLTLALLAAACMAQGGLIYAIGARHRRNEPTSLQAFKVGALAFWPIAAVNAVAICATWVCRFLVALPLYLAIVNPTAAWRAVYLVSAVVFIALQLIIPVIEVFALNAMIFHGASAAQAIARGYQLFKRHWVVAIETAVLLFAIAVGVIIVTLGVIFVVLVPVVMMSVVAIAWQSLALFVSAMAIGLILSVALILAALAFLTQLQYATWSLLYRRIGEHGVVPKLHRFVRDLIGNHRVPQS